MAQLLSTFGRCLSSAALRAAIAGATKAPLPAVTAGDGYSRRSLGNSGSIAYSERSTDKSQAHQSPRVPHQRLLAYVSTEIAYCGIANSKVRSVAMALPLLRKRAD